jgi:hypothetical protein
LTDQPVHTIPTSYSPSELWTIAENATLDSAQTVDGQLPNLLTPVSVYITTAAGAIRLFGALQDELDNSYGLVLDLLSNPPIDPNNIGSSTFMTIAQAVYTRLVALGSSS